MMGIDGNDTERADSPLRKKSKHLEGKGTIAYYFLLTIHSL